MFNIGRLLTVDDDGTDDRKTPDDIDLSVTTGVALSGRVPGSKMVWKELTLTSSPEISDFSSSILIFRF